MKVEQSGWYKTRDGRLAEVVVSDCVPNDFGTQYPVTGYIVKSGKFSWTLDGTHQVYGNESVNRDLVEYLGKERPKERKTVKMAPAFCSDSRGIHISRELFRSRKEADEALGPYVLRWLIDTPYEIEVEVDE